MNNDSGVVFSGNDSLALKRIAVLFSEVDKIWSGVSREAQDKILEAHNTESSLNHCIRWGVQAAEDIAGMVKEVAVEIPSQPASKSTCKWHHINVTNDCYVDFGKELMDFTDSGNTSIDSTITFALETAGAYMTVRSNNESGNSHELDGQIPLDWDSAIALISKDVEIPLVLAHYKKDGLFSGAILDVADGVVTQKIGRNGETVKHAEASLNRRVMKGEVLDIKYKSGQAHVPGVGISSSVAR